MVGGCVRLLIGDQRGVSALFVAATLPVLLGTVGLGVEASVWYETHRRMQNAADAAVLAASANGGATYAGEAKAVAATYGFVDGVKNVTVTASNTAACPSGGNTCYSVTITGSVPVMFSRLVGNTGNITVSGVSSTGFGASAAAAKTARFCLLALAGSGADPAFLSNGGPKANMAGCDIMSNTGATCHGHDLGADTGNAHGVNDGCGVVQNSGVPIVKDPYAKLASNIPSNTCSSYPQEPTKKNDPPLPATNQWSGSEVLSGNNIVCGDLQLTGNVTITAAPAAVLVIENGQLDTQNYTLQTVSGSGLTVVFSGSNGSYTHAPTGGGALDIAAPTSGAWAGVAIYQDPSLTSGVDISAAGNSPTWDITGLVYLPHSSVTFSGAVNKSSNGGSCFGLVVDNITINGTGSILTNGGCIAAGLELPTSRGQLYQ